MTWNGRPQVKIVAHVTHIKTKENERRVQIYGVCVSPSFLTFSPLVTTGTTQQRNKQATTKKHDFAPAFIRPFKLHCNTVATCNGHEINTFNLNLLVLWQILRLALNLAHL